MPLLVAAALAMGAVGATAAIPNPAAMPAVSRAKIEEQRRRREKKKTPGTRDPKTDRAWRRERQIERLKEYAANRKAVAGSRVDRIGNVINHVRREKKFIRRELNLSSGRAWRRWKKAAERADRALRRVP